MNRKNLLIESVYSLNLTQRATLVAFYLINRADSEGTCFPGVKTIAKECNISTRTVQRALNDLEEADFLVRESRFHVQGGQRSNLYYLQIDEIDAIEEVEVIIDEVSSQRIVQVYESKEKENVEGNRYSKSEFNSKLDVLKSMERIDFSMYLANKAAAISVSGGEWQRDGP